MKLTLTKQTCDDYLQKYLEVGYKSSKVFSIKEGAFIAKYSRLLSGNEKDDKVTPSTIYTTVFQFLELMNKNGAFTLGDASILDLINNYIKDNIINVEAKPVTPKVKVDVKPEEPEEPKIKEI